MRAYTFLIIINISMSLIFKPAWQNEGKGARVIRIIGNQYLRRLDPFLMLDFFHVKLPAGFPDHPHRGFETITYMISGKVHHQDFKGHKGTIGPGDLQWMTAGKGIVHAQMPFSHEETSIGYQLWLNLKSDKKMIEPQYQQYTKDQIPVIDTDEARVKIICGQWENQKGPIKYQTPAIYMDVQLPKDGKFQLPIKSHWNSIIYVFEGNVIYSSPKGDKAVELNYCCVLDKGQNNEIVHKFKTIGDHARFLIIAGQPLNQPVVNYGPFVMNTQEQIQQTFKDYQLGKNGFQNALKWESKIQKLADGVQFEEL